MAKLTFSIIIPCYNSAQWVTECIDSVLGQDYTEVEIILVDDGSADATASICAQYAASDPRIKFIKQENQGVVAARYNGYLASSGDVILFVDSDDRVKPGALSVLFKIYCEHDVDLVRFGFEYCDENWSTYKTIVPLLTEEINQQALFLHCREQFTSISSSAIFDKAYRRNLVDKVFAQLKEKKIRHSEDMLFSIFALAYSKNTFFFAPSLYAYLQRQGSVIHSYNATALEDKRVYISSLHQLYEHLPIEYHFRIDQLINQEAYEAVGYVLSNCCNYGEGYHHLIEVIRQVRISEFYKEQVFFKSKRLKPLLRDLLITTPCLYAGIIFSRKHFSPKK